MVFLTLHPKTASLLNPASEYSGLTFSSSLRFLMKVPTSQKTYFK